MEVSEIPTLEVKTKKTVHAPVGKHLHHERHGFADPFVWILFGFEFIIILFFGLFTDYGDASELHHFAGHGYQIHDYYPFFQDVHAMIFVGFGFLITYMRKYGLSAIGFNFLLAVVSIQWGILVVNFFDQTIHYDGKGYHAIHLDITTLIKADFGAGAVLISACALLGRVSFPQLFCMAIFELIFYAINEAIGVAKFHAVDMGGSMFVHIFGAYFGLAVSWSLDNIGHSQPEINEETEKDRRSDYRSDLFAMIGCIFLWMYWPSFNGAMAPVAALSQHRVVINTVLALVTSCCSAYIVSRATRSEHKLFDMEDIQNATLAGGVAVGSSSDLVIGPFAAMLVGAVAGGLCTYGYVNFSPWLEKNFRLRDSCGVHNLHAIPGIIGAIGGVISSATATDEAYGDNIGRIFEARAPEDIDEHGHNHGGLGWSAATQAQYQFCTFLLTFGIAIFGGLFVGQILKSNIFATTQLKFPYLDNVSWEVPEEQTPYYFDERFKKKK